MERFTAAQQYGAVGFGAGPQGSATARRDDAMAPVTAIDAAPSASSGMPDSVRAITADPTFWLFVNIGAVLALAAYSAR